MYVRVCVEGGGGVFFFLTSAREAMKQVKIIFVCSISSRSSLNQWHTLYLIDTRLLHPPHPPFLLISYAKDFSLGEKRTLSKNALQLENVEKRKEQKQMRAVYYYSQRLNNLIVYRKDK